MSEPDWHCLPHDPQGFFQLPSDFDRKALKRRYNEFLKQFKPEKFPEEFQKIRAAYEALDQRLRYGADIGMPSIELPQYRWNVDVVDTPVSQPLEPVSDAGSSEPRSRPRSQEPPPPPTRPKSWTERLRDESPASVLEALKQIGDKRPFHFFALALIEDSAPDAERLVFLKWLLRGWKRWPGDPAITELIANFLKHDVSEEDAPQVLRAVAKIVKGDEFYFLTESLWDRLLRVLPFAQFRRLLEECESQLMDHRVAARTAFYIHLLKPALWLADDDWIEAAFDQIIQENQQLLWRFEVDLELLQQLKDYLGERLETVGDHPLRREMDRVIRSYCIDDEQEFDRQFLTCSVRLGSESDTVFSAFPLEMDRDSHGALYRLWIWLDREVSERHGIPHDSADPTKLAKSVRSLLRRTQERSDSTSRGWVWKVYWLIFLAGYALSFGAVYLLLWGLMEVWFAIPQSGPPAAATGSTGKTVFWGFGTIVGGWLLGRRYFRPLWYRFCRYWAQVCYHHIWRPELVPFLRQTRLPYGDFLELVGAAESEDLHCSGWINHFTRNDYGLALLSMSQRYIV